MKNSQVIKHINELCLQSGMQPVEFYNRICDAINADESSSVDIPDKGNVNKWYNGKHEPGAEMIPYIAKALGVSEDEIRLGRKPETDYLKDEIDKLNDVLNMNEEEKKQLSKLLFIGRYYLRLFALFLYAMGFVFLNSMIWQSGWGYLIAIILIVVAYRYDVLRYRNQFGNEKQNLPNKVKSDFEFLKYLLKKDLVSRLSLNILIVMMTIIFLPVLETSFYRGKFYITCTVYFLIATLLLIKSIFRK